MEQITKVAPMKRRQTIFTTLPLALALTGCQTAEPPGGPLSAEIEASSPVSALQRINELGQQCWIRSGSRDFANLAMVPELDTTADPRILIVEKGKGQGLPLLVISAAGEPVRITTFGPLVQKPVSNRINADIGAWSAGRNGCA